MLDLRMTMEQLEDENIELRKEYLKVFKENKELRRVLENIQKEKEWKKF